METRYLYFNKTTFRHLIKVWRLLNCDNNTGLVRYSDDDLMKHFIPDKFIDDIENTIKMGRK
jgi:hypothetical protein